MNGLDFSASFQIPESTLFQVSDGAAVLLSLEKETYFTLDEVGTRIWEVLQTEKTIQETFELLLAEYEVESEELRSDLVSFLSELLQSGLIVYRDD